MTVAGATPAGISRCEDQSQIMIAMCTGMEIASPRRSRWTRRCRRSRRRSSTRSRIRSARITGSAPAEELGPGAFFRSGCESGSAIRGAHESGRSHYGPNSFIPHSDVRDPPESRIPLHHCSIRTAISNSRVDSMKAEEILRLTASRRGSEDPPSRSRSLFLSHRWSPK
jgi:hypothetical protein